MNLNLMDPKLLMLAGVVILVIAIVVWLYVQKRRSTTAGLRQKFGPEYERAVLKHGQNEKQKRNYWIARNGLKNSTFATLIRWNTNVFQNGGSRYSLVLSIPQRGQSQKPTIWCPL